MPIVDPSVFRNFMDVTVLSFKATEASVESFEHVVYGQTAYDRVMQENLVGGWILVSEATATVEFH
jgi:hypothetical protein